MVRSRQEDQGATTPDDHTPDQCAVSAAEHGEPAAGDRDPHTDASLTRDCTDGAARRGDEQRVLAGTDDDAAEWGRRRDGGPRRYEHEERGGKRKQLSHSQPLFLGFETERIHYLQGVLKRAKTCGGFARARRRAGASVSAVAHSASGAEIVETPAPGANLLR